MKRPTRSWLTWLTRNRLVIGIVFISIFTMAIRYPAGHDTWWHLRAGEMMLETQTILSSDPFSHTKMGHDWVNIHWLGQVIMAGIFHLGGWSGMSIALAGIITITFVIIWKQSKGNIYIKAFGVILGAIVSSLVWIMRTQMVSFFFVALTAYLLYRFKHHNGKLMPYLPLIVVLWVNCHAGFIIAFILLICYVMGELVNYLTQNPSPFEGEGQGVGLSHVQWKHLMITIGVCIIASLINPFTWHVWELVFKTVNIGALQNFIAEWQSPNFHDPIIQPFLLMLLILLAAIARCDEKMDWTDLALVGAWTTMSLIAVRNIAVFAIVCTPILIRYSDKSLTAQFGTLTIGNKRHASKIAYMFNWSLLALILVTAIAQMIITISPSSMRHQEKEMFPVDAVAFIKHTKPQSPMFNDYNHGGYLIYHLYPQYLVFVDGRTDLYDDVFLQDYMQINHVQPNWQQHLSDYGIQLVVTEQLGLLDLALRKETNWTKLYRDEHVTIFERKP